ncbi:MAG TPA: Hsp20/alpha crystallin family protein [Vicinamibacterales bacterium]|nr:Hsp20/alpha crystallin family protein [Vicinamibacterales bacterium]
MAWDPTRDLLAMQERLENLFGRCTPGWMPAVDLAEFADRYVLSMELPGLRRDDVTIEVQDHTLRVHGQRRNQPTCPDRYLQFERGYGAFARAFQFNTPVDAERVSADLSDGVLTVVVPKAEALHRQIDIA